MSPDYALIGHIALLVVAVALWVVSVAIGAGAEDDAILILPAFAFFALAAGCVLLAVGR